MAERLLVLAVDIDNDLYRKARVSGPVIGRIDNLKAAAKLALADPEDADANAMFEAVRKYDELKAKGYSVNVATITGAEKEGYVADIELVRQIEIVLERLKSDACVLVTDGSSDARVLPLLKSRIKVNSVDIVRMKQAPGLENTYFTILEKLKEPHYSRIVFGIPAVLLILFAVSYWFHFGWQPPVAIIGVYLIIKGFGLEDALVNSFRGLGFSVERLSFVFYIGSIIFFIISLIIGYASYSTALATTNNALLLGSQALEGFLILFPISLILYLVGRIIDLENKRMRYRAISQGTYVGYAVVGLALLYLTSAWIIGQIYFWQFLVLSMASVVAGYGVSLFSAFLRRRAIKRAKIKDKRVINDIGAYIGRITDVDSKRGLIFVKTDYGSVIKYDVDRITGVSDRVVIR
jgi:putative membrane protein